jgi:hypothetical protein
MDHTLRQYKGEGLTAYYDREGNGGSPNCRRDSDPHHRRYHTRERGRESVQFSALIIQHNLHRNLL